MSSAGTALIALADRIGPMMQYHSPGFLNNRKQYRQFGLAALEVAQVRWQPLQCARCRSR